MKKFIKEQLRTALIREARVLIPNRMDHEEPLRDSDTIRVYHGFNSYEDAIIAVKFGLSGKQKAKRVYSPEANHNPHGLFVTLDFETAKRFVYPRGSTGITVVMELHVKVSDLEAPIWPGGKGYAVQGQKSDSWGGDHDRAKEMLNARQEAIEWGKKYNIDFVINSERPELALTLYGSERQALFVGHLNNNMVRAIFYGESGKHGYSPKQMDRISTKDFLNKFDSHEPETNYDGKMSNKGYEYWDKENMSHIFKPNDDFNPERVNAYLKEIEWGVEYEEFIKKLIKHRSLERYFWPKQVAQIKDMLDQDTQI